MKIQTKRKKVLLISSIVLAVIILGTGVFLLWPRMQPKVAEVMTNQPEDSQKEVDPVPTQVNTYEGWMTYVSNRDGYELKYPADWIVIPESSSDGPYIRNMQFTGGAYAEGYINLRILRDVGIVSGSDLSTNDWYNKLGVSTVTKGPVSFAPDTVEAYTLNGLDAKKAKSIFTEIDEDIFLLHNNALYEINMYPYGISENEVVKKILASFKFLS